MYNPAQAQETGTWSALKYKHYQRHESNVGENIKIISWTHQGSLLSRWRSTKVLIWMEATRSEAEESPSCEIVLNTSVLHRDQMPDWEG